MAVILRGQEWRKVPFAPDYEVSEFGAVRRLNTKGRYKTGRLVARTRHVFGYPVVNLSRPDKGRGWPCEVHTVVANAFLPPKPFQEAQTAHLDGDVENNHWKNFSWVTQKENVSHRVAHGTSPRGQQNGCAKLSAQDILNIRILCRHRTQQSVADQYKISFQQVSRIVRGVRWGWL